MAFLILSQTALLVMWSLYEMPHNFLKHRSGLKFLLDICSQRLLGDNCASFPPRTLMSMLMPSVLVVNLVFSELLSMPKAEKVLSR